MKNPMFGKAFAKAMAAAGAAGAAGMAAAAAAGVVGEGRSGVNSVVVSTSGGSGAGTVSVTGINAVPGKVSGVTIIDGKVWIDGEPLAEGVTAYTAPSGRKYTIHRDNGHVQVVGE